MLHHPSSGSKRLPGKRQIPRNRRHENLSVLPPHPPTKKRQPRKKLTHPPPRRHRPLNRQNRNLHHLRHLRLQPPRPPRRRHPRARRLLPPIPSLHPRLLPRQPLRAVLVPARHGREEGETGRVFRGPGGAEAECGQGGAVGQGD